MDDLEYAVIDVVADYNRHEHELVTNGQGECRWFGPWERESFVDDFGRCFVPDAVKFLYGRPEDWAPSSRRPDTD